MKQFKNYKKNWSHTNAAIYKMYPHVLVGTVKLLVDEHQNVDQVALLLFASWSGCEVAKKQIFDFNDNR